MSAIDAATRIRRIIVEQPLHYATEDELQASIATRLEAHDIAVIREHILDNGAGRIDHIAVTQQGECIGIEVKIAGSTAAVTRQVIRYAQHPHLDAVVLVTTKATHHRIPAWINKHHDDTHPVLLATLVGATL